MKSLPGHGGGCPEGGTEGHHGDLVVSCRSESSNYKLSLPSLYFTFYQDKKIMIQTGCMKILDIAHDSP